MLVVMMSPLLMVLCLMLAVIGQPSSLGKFMSRAMGLRTFLLIFIIAFIGAVLNLFPYYQGLYMTSSSIATATSNLVLTVTFLFAVLLRLKLYLCLEKFGALV